MNLFDLLHTQDAIALTLYALIAGCLAMLLLRIADEAVKRPRNHAAIFAASFLAFALVVRVGHLWAGDVRLDWSMVLGWAGLLVLLAVDPAIAARITCAWRRVSGQPQVTMTERTTYHFHDKPGTPGRDSIIVDRPKRRSTD